MTDYDKPALDALTDGATGTLRELELMPLHELYAEQVAGHFAVQFPGVPELPRIVLACAQMMAPLGAEDIRGSIVIGILGRTGLRLLDGQVPGG